MTEHVDVMVVAAHPDDAEFGVAGTVAKWTKEGKKVVYELFNTNGQVARKTTNGNASQTETINVNSLAPGFYIVRATCEGEIAQQKVIKR